MIHICGERFSDRAPDQRTITVFTNCDNVTLVVNDEVIGSQQVSNHVAVFENVALTEGENTVRAYSGDVTGNTVILHAVSEPNTAYMLPKEESAAGNWFDDIRADAVLEFPDGFFSIKDTVGEMLDHPVASKIINDLFDRMFAGLDNSKDMQKSIEMCRNMALEPLLVISKAAKGTDAYLNEKLNKIPKE